MSLADEFAAIAKAAFIAGAMSEVKKQSKKAGTAVVSAGASGLEAGAKKVKRKASAYSKRYGKAFRKVAPRFKLKSGSWKTNGFKNAQKAAHKLAKR